MRATIGAVRPRLCLATDSLVPSGVGRHMIELGRALRDRYDPMVAAAPASGLLETARKAGLAVLPLPAETPEQIAARLKRAHPAILHIHAGIGWEGHDLARAGRLAGIETLLRTEHLPFLLTDPGQIAEHRESLEWLDALVCVSGDAERSFREAGIGGGLLHAVPNGIEPVRALRSRAETRRALSLSDGAPVLLCAARFTDQKGHATLLGAMPIVLTHHPDAVLLLAGTGPLAAEMRRLAARNGLGERVRFLGERSDVADLLYAADLFVLPSRFEGLPLAVLEAMSVGRAVVATDIGGTREAVRHDETGWLVPPDRPGELAEAIVAALRDPEARDAAGEAGRRRFTQHFSSIRMADDFDRLYRDLQDRPHQEHRMTKTRIAFVGAGGIAHRHLGVLDSFEDVEIVGFADPDGARAQDAAARYGAPTFADAAAMMDALKPDAVYICVPPFAHGAPERAAIERGIPFFVEKPVALDLETAETIARDVEAAGLVTATGYHWRYLDTVDEARRLLRDNPAQLMSGYWLDSTPPPQWWWKRDRSGGQMIEQTTHLIDLARFLGGEVTEVYGRAGHAEREAFPGLDVPTTSTATLTFASGVVANLASTCLLGWNHRVGLHIFADKLAIELTDRDIMVDVGRGRPVRGADGDPVWREDRDFVDAVRGAENRIRCPYSDALETHRLALAIDRSAQTGEVERFPTTGRKRPEPAPLVAQPRHDPPPGLPPGHRHVRSLGVERPGEAYFFQYEEGPPADGHVRLDTLYTGFSAGTELTFYKNTNPYLHSRWDGGRGVFVPGEAGQHFPVPFLGYMECARVSESRSAAFRPGEIVASTYAHKSGHTADPFHELLVPLPETIDPILGIYVAQMGPIAANGILHADAEIGGANVDRLGSGVAGRPTLVIGAGVVGLLTALFAAKAGAAEVVVADPSPFRRARAEALGFRAMDENTAWNHAKAAWHHGGGDRGADFVFQTRADARSLHAALRALRPQGTVIDLAFYQGGADAVRLGEEFHHNGLAIRCAQINRVPRGLGFSWNRRRLAQETVALLASRGDDVRREMITQVVPFDDAPRFLSELVAERPDFLQIVFQVAS